MHETSRLGTHGFLYSLVILPHGFPAAFSYIWLVIALLCSATPAFGADIDGDGIYDSWEKRYGLDPTDAADAVSDKDGDGTTAYQEFRLASDPLDKQSTGSTDLYSDSFERSRPLRNWWKPLGTDNGWSLTTVTSFDGDQSLQSNDITHGQTAAVAVALLTNESQVRLRYYWNAQDGDHFRILRNGVQVFTTVDGGIRGWSTTPYISLPAGYNELRFEFTKDGAGNDFCDCVRIDALVIETLDQDFDQLPDAYENSYFFLGSG